MYMYTHTHVYIHPCISKHKREGEEWGGGGITHFSHCSIKNVWHQKGREWQAVKQLTLPFSCWAVMFPEHPQEVIEQNVEYIFDTTWPVAHQQLKDVQQAFLCLITHTRAHRHRHIYDTHTHTYLQIHQEWQEFTVCGPSIPRDLLVNLILGGKKEPA